MSEKNTLFPENKDYEACKTEAPDTKQIQDAITQLDKNIPDWIEPLQKLIIPLQEKIDSLPDCYERQILKKQLQELEDLRIAYKQFRDEKFTATTNERVRLLFDKITLDNLESKKKNITTIMKDERQKLKDTLPGGRNSYRDHVENAIDFNAKGFFDITGHLFNGTWNETKEIEEFLKLFTIEYINTLDRNGKGEIDTDSKTLHISKSELEDTLKNLGQRIKRSHLGMKLNIDGGKEVNVNFREYTKDYKDSEKTRETIQRTWESLKKLQTLGFVKECPDILSESGIAIEEIDDPKKLKKVLESLEEKHKDEVINYQIAKGLIIQEKSPGAGEIIPSDKENKITTGENRNVGAITEKNIELSLKIFESAKKRLTGEVSQELLKKETEDQNMLFGEFIGYSKSIEKKLEHIGYESTEDGVIEYQLSRGIIKYEINPETNKEELSYGAGHIGNKTTKSIENDYNRKIKAEGGVKYHLPEGIRNFGTQLVQLYILGKTAYHVDLGNGIKKNVTITQKDIENNKWKIQNNIGAIIGSVLSVESHGGRKYSKNTDLSDAEVIAAKKKGKELTPEMKWEQGSSAKDIYQILDGHKLGVLNPIYNREKGQYTTFDVCLRYMKQVYAELGIPLPEYVQIAYDNPGVISPLDLTFEQNTELFLVYLFKKSKAKGIEDQLVAAIGTGNIYAIEMLYAKVHNTAVSKKTSKVMKDRQLLAFRNRR